MKLTKAEKELVLQQRKDLQKMFDDYLKRRRQERDTLLTRIAYLDRVIDKGARPLCDCDFKCCGNTSCPAVLWDALP